MGRSVELSDVVPEIERFGALATLITVGEHGEPHVGSVLVEVGDERLVVRVGPTTAANMSRRPAVSLSWLPSAGGDYQLIVDGVAEADGEPDGDGLIPVRSRSTRASSTGWRAAPTPVRPACPSATAPTGPDRRGRLTAATPRVRARRPNTSATEVPLAL